MTQLLGRNRRVNPLTQPLFAEFHIVSNLIQKIFHRKGAKAQRNTWLMPAGMARPVHSLPIIVIPAQAGIQTSAQISHGFRPSPE
jgi:hypothetical protein